MRGDGVPIWRRWRESAVQAALVNGALMLLTPVAVVIYADYSSDALRPYSQTLRAVLNALPALVLTVPVAFLVAWRTYVHARAYRIRPVAAWRGPVESTAIAGGIALIVMLRMTAAPFGDPLLESAVDQRHLVMPDIVEGKEHPGRGHHLAVDDNVRLVRDPFLSSW